MANNVAVSSYTVSLLMSSKSRVPLEKDYFEEWTKDYFEEWTKDYFEEWTKNYVPVRPNRTIA